MGALRSACLTGCLLAASAFAQDHRHPDYLRGYEEWSAQHWPAASTVLSRYWRSVPYAQSYDVAYWLGTSWCRMPGSELPGVDLLDWSYHFQSMPESARTRFREQRDLCIGWTRGGAATGSPPAIVIADAWTNATMRAEGKTYYIGRGDKGGLTAYPVRLKRKLPDREFAGRLVPVGEAGQVEQSVRARVPGFNVHVGRTFVLASATHTVEQLTRITGQLDRYARFLEGTFRLPPPSHYVTVYLFADIPALRRAADRLHGLDASPMTLGYSLQNDLSVLAMVPGTQPGTVLHEVFHLMLRGGFGNAPQWLDEGYASLYETTTSVGGRYFGEPNWRSRVFDDLRGAFPRTSLRDVIVSPWFSDEPSLVPQPGERRLDPDEQAYMLAYARMFALYLQQQGRLVPVLAAFRDRATPAQYLPAPEQAVRLLEQAFGGQSIASIEQDFLKWAPGARDPDTRLDHTAAASRMPPIEITDTAAPDYIDRE